MEATANLQNFYLPFLRMKRPHTKSRSGCVICKRRHIKCDENRPCCDRCRMRGLECSYPQEPALPSQSSDIANPQATAEHVDACLSDDQLGRGHLPETRSSHLLDNELPRHYLEHTTQTLLAISDRKEQSWFWQVFVPALAYTSQTVRHGMFVLTSLCLHFHSNQSTEQSYKYLKAAEAYGEIFVPRSRQQLHELQKSDTHSNLACSRLLSVISLAFFRHYRDLGVDLMDASRWTWLHLLRGVSIVGRHALESGESMDPMIMQYLNSELSPASCFYKPHEQTVKTYHNHPVFDDVLRSRAERLGALRGAFERGSFSLDEEGLNDSLAAIDNLIIVTEHVCSDKVHSLYKTLCTWPCQLTNGYVVMLTACYPPALVIYSHWLMLLILAEDLWWVGDMGRAGIRAVCEICAKMDPHLRALIAQPQPTLDVA